MSGNAGTELVKHAWSALGSPCGQAISLIFLNGKITPDINKHVMKLQVCNDTVGIFTSIPYH